MDLTPEEHAKLAVDGSLRKDDVVCIQASDDPRNIHVSDYQQVQWLIDQGDEYRLMQFVQDLHRRAYDKGREQGRAERGE